MSRITFTQDQNTDIQLLSEGTQKIHWASAHMPLLREIETGVIADKSFAGIKIAVHAVINPATAQMCNVLKASGADVFISDANPLSTQQDVATALAVNGITVYAHSTCSEADCAEDRKSVLKHAPDIVIDEEGELLNLICDDAKNAEKQTKIRGYCVVTATGTTRAGTLLGAGKLAFPVITANSAICKNLCATRHGVGQTVWTAIVNCTNLSLCSKTAVVVGYGSIGRGVATKARGFGMRVIVVEANPLNALSALFDGYEVMQMKDAVCLGDFFVTATGADNVITKDHFKSMKHGAVCCNAGSGSTEIDVSGLESISAEWEELRPHVFGYVFDTPDSPPKRIDIIAGGKPIDLVVGDGYPIDAADVSLALQVVSAQYLANSIRESSEPTEPSVINIPISVDSALAMALLNINGAKIDHLTPEQ